MKMHQCLIDFEIDFLKFYNSIYIDNRWILIVYLIYFSLIHIVFNFNS